MSSPKEQHDARRKATVVGTSQPGRDAEPGAARAAGTGAEAPEGAHLDAAAGAPRPADPTVKSSEEP
jgi:hypothetical protein